MIPLLSLDYDDFLADHPMTNSKQPRAQSKQKKETPKEGKVRVLEEHERLTEKNGLVKTNRAIDSPKKDLTGKVLAESKILNQEVENKEEKQVF